MCVCVFLGLCVNVFVSASEFPYCVCVGACVCSCVRLWVRVFVCVSAG